MNEVAEILGFAILIGAGATAIMDVWGIARRRLFGAAMNYGLVGRWLAHLFRGRFRHDSIAASPPVNHEHLLGWTAHYLIGIVFAGALLALFGLDWARNPTLGPALVIGVGSVAAPFLIMQPGMGLGVAASRAPRPSIARMHSLLTHTIFGVGLYVTARVMNLSTAIG